MNAIRNIQFDFSVQTELFARELYAGWDTFFSSSFEKIADELLKKYDTTSEVIEIDLLPLDIGTLNENNFYEMFPIRLRDVMEESLKKHLYISENNISESLPTRRVSIEKNAFDLLCHFLLHGTLPWNVSSQYTDVTHLFLEVIRTSPAALKRFLQLYGHYTSLQRRLVYQLNDPALEEGVRLMRSTDSSFICSYVYYLREKYNALDRPEITITDYRHAVWTVVYTWMLTDRSSSFDKKSFLKQILSGLAAHLNTSYVTLLRIITNEIRNLSAKQQQLPELLRLLQLLRKESVVELQKIKTPDIADLFEYISITLPKEFEAQWDQSSLSSSTLAVWLIPILGHPDTCRAFLLRLKEEEIIRMVPVVMPQESDFIISYAHSLDKQKEQGCLQGKAGSEFTRLKWMVIFRVLLENRGEGFNRKYFVGKVLHTVASRYNLTVIELLHYFVQDNILMQIDNNLATILKTLYQEQLKSTPSDEQPVISGLKEKLIAGKPLTKVEIKELHQLWKQPREAFHFLSRISEKQYIQLVSTFAREEKEFILLYDSVLDQYKQQGLLQGKAGGEFRQVKWYFIIHILTEKITISINRKSFTASLLRQLAAHYNLSYFELLQYFFVKDRAGHIPSILASVLHNLYQEEKRQLITRIMRAGREAERYRLLELFYPEQVPFIRSFLRLMDTIPLRQEISIRNSYTDFIWENIFSLLNEQIGNKTVKYIYIKRLLHSFATHYNIKAENIYKQLSNSIRQGTNVPAELKQIIMAENNPWNDLDFIQPNNNVNQPGEPDAYYVHNAGVVLIFPFCTRLFSILKLVEQGKFISEDAKIHAIFALQYLVYGDEYSRKEFPEYELTLNKILVGYHSDAPLPKSWELSEDTKKTSDDMLRGVLNHWEKLSRTSTTALRQAFLERSGALKVEEERYLLTVEEKAYDILIDSLPWSYKQIRYPWMDKRIEVKWR